METVFTKRLTAGRHVYAASSIQWRHQANDSGSLIALLLKGPFRENIFINK